jgi:predicted nucleic acid-binding Zn ribbon protein
VKLKFPERIDRIMPRVLKSLELEDRIKNMIILEKWQEIVGEKIAQHTRATSIDSENLFVTVDNPVWQGQLFLMKDKILKKVKEYGISIKDIKLAIM